ncbi:MAG TPA: SMC-Scp complex subunit ScpB [Syntrophales bacterium]|jgi:segregation and condensation protein B|nr:SMC-Scp complex subunit ScpB [Syntrophales bacterium]
MEHDKALIEALLFAAETPVTLERLREVLDMPREAVQAAVLELMQEYQERRGGFTLEEVAGGIQFRTLPEYGTWIRKMKGRGPASLSPAALETLAVVAYRQPIVKADIDRVRGVDAGGTLKGLVEKKLVRIVGRKDVPGKPILYGTTRRFLEIFDLQDLSELPTLREFGELAE